MEGGLALENSSQLLQKLAMFSSVERICAKLQFDCLVACSLDRSAARPLALALERIRARARAHDCYVSGAYKIFGEKNERGRSRFARQLDPVSKDVIPFPFFPMSFTGISNHDFKFSNFFPMRLPEKPSSAMRSKVMRGCVSEVQEILE